ncbi:MAG: metallophosphoesterase [Ruminococcaceae bacterium]|nr:metallophosphoesterase [Oscillospiraceae bacterium]
MKNKRVLKIGALFLCLILVVGTFIVYSNFKLETTEYTIGNPGLPKSFDGYKIVHLSDLHNAEFGENNKNLIKIIKEENPDAVFVTGDTIDGFYTNTTIPIDLFKEVLKICDVYFIVGNHEIRSDTNIYYEFLDKLAEIGVTVLKDDSTYIEKSGERIQVIGLNDASDYKANYNDNYKEEIVKTINNLDNKESFSVLLSHHPELFDDYAKTNVDLVFSGHAHGGQFRLPFIGGLIAPEQGLFPEFDAGVFNENNTTMVVSRGLGNSIIPVRINNSPEVVVVTFEG